MSNSESLNSSLVYGLLYQLSLSYRRCKSKLLNCWCLSSDVAVLPWLVAHLTLLRACLWSLLPRQVVQSTARTPRSSYFTTQRFSMLPTSLHLDENSLAEALRSLQIISRAHLWNLQIILKSQVTASRALLCSMHRVQVPLQLGRQCLKWAYFLSFSVGVESSKSSSSKRLQGPRLAPRSLSLGLHLR